MLVKNIVIAGAVTAAMLGLAPSALAATGTTADLGTYSASGCTGTTCIYVNGSGLRVNYATVTKGNGNRSGAG